MFEWLNSFLHRQNWFPPMKRKVYEEKGMCLSYEEKGVCLSYEEEKGVCVCVSTDDWYTTQ